MRLVLISMLSMVGLGVFFAVVLAAVDRRMRVEEDGRISKITEILPGANCGACGIASCHSFAEAAVKSKEELVCTVGGEKTSQEIAAILGIEHTALTKKIAVIRCGVKEPQRKRRTKYLGIESCQAVELLNHGDMECSFGCLGYGDCIQACPFGAIEIREGSPEIITDKCTSCGKCVAACPRKIISLEDFDQDRGMVLVACSSEDKGAVVRKICAVGCIGCGICVKLCPEGGFELRENLAWVDAVKLHKYQKAKECSDWSKAIEKCPVKCIVEVK